jgi:hypothetical protein
MNKVTWLLRVVGTIQIILGLFYLIAPGTMLQLMGHNAVSADIYYPLGILSSRLLAYGVIFLIISSEPARHSLWLQGMVMIQAIDLAVGIFYTVNGLVPLSLSGFAMFNASWVIILLLLWMPREHTTAAAL